MHLRPLFALGLLAAFALASSPNEANAGNKTRMLVVAPDSMAIGSARAHFEDVADRLGSLRGWSTTVTKVAKSESAANGFSPAFAILSLDAYLRLERTSNLTVVGQMTGARGGRQYRIVSKTASSLGGCKGAARKLATDDAGDRRFVERVVADGAFDLDDFKLTKVSKPKVALQRVLSGKARCALVDDAQWADRGHLAGGNSLKSVWASSQLPPPVVVSFPGVSNADRAGVKAAMSTLCSGAGRSACAKLGVSFRPADASAYASARGRYQ